ncbi:MAG: hypothetical protein MI810_23710, partial [Flavobacteriales bacterium]|nr:hypothetical protein [Flavobacteriales bacterium]
LKQELAIPMVGGTLSTLYFGRKQEKRFIRLECFYQEIKDDFDSIREKVSEKLENIDQDSLTGIIEEINENVEKDYLDSKRTYFKNCFYNSLISQDSDSYGKRKYFIETLGKLTDMDIQIIQNLYGAESNSGYTPELKNTQENNAEFNGSLEKLKSYGLLHSKLNGTLHPSINWAEITLYIISDFGREFVEYCLKVDE